jgi:hypothetical protein
MSDEESEAGIGDEEESEENKSGILEGALV